MQLGSWPRPGGHLGGGVAPGGHRHPCGRWHARDLEVRGFTGKPILLSEVGVGPGTGRKPQDIAAVFGGIRAQHLLGSVWFDVDQHGGAGYQDWRLEGDQAAVAAFRQSVRGMKLARPAA